MKIGRTAEVIALIVSILVFVGIFIPTVSSTPHNPERIITRMTVSRLQQAVEMYRGEYVSYPKLQKEELLAAVSGGNPRGIRFWEPKKAEKRFYRSTTRGDLNDSGELIYGWSNPFVWTVSQDGRTLTLISKGANGVYEEGETESDDMHFAVIQPLNL